MQEVFEKIIERLANIGWVFADYYPDGTNISRVSKKSVPYDEVVEIVKQAAADCNNGWIPCSERLPEEPEITGDVEEDIYNGKLNEYIGMIYGAEKPTILYYAGERCWYDEVSQDYYPVRAWQPLPEQYQPKGE